MAIFFLYLFNEGNFHFTLMAYEDPLLSPVILNAVKLDTKILFNAEASIPSPTPSYPLTGSYFHNQASWIRKIFFKLNRFLCYGHFKCSLPTHLVSSLFSDHNSDQLSRTTQTQGSTIGHAQGINFGRLRANFPCNVFRETSKIEN